MSACEVTHSAYNGYGQCDRPAAMRFGYDVAECNGAMGCEQEPTTDYCQAHGNGRLEAIKVRGNLVCGCTLLEVVDLVKADPGVEYADMLRAI